MNKQTFLAELERELADLSPDERKDILRDMDEYFHEAMSRGMGEEDVLKKLGAPKAFSETILAEAKVKRMQTATGFSKKVPAFFGALGAILLLTPFNLFFVLLPLLFATLFIVIGWPLILVLIASLPILLIVSTFIIINIGFKIFALLSILFFIIGWFGMVVAIVIGFSYITLFYFKGIARLFQWNIQFVKNRARGE